MGQERAAARLFVAHWARVAVADVDRAAAQATIELLSELGGSAVSVTGDLGVETDVRQMVGEATDHLGSLRILYLQAEVLWKDRDRSVVETQGSWWDHAMAINQWRVRHGQVRHPPSHRGWGPRHSRRSSRVGISRVHASPRCVYRIERRVDFAHEVVGGSVHASRNPGKCHPSGHRRDADAGAVPCGLRGADSLLTFDARPVAASQRQRRSRRWRSSLRLMTLRTSLVLRLPSTAPAPRPEGGRVTGRSVGRTGAKHATSLLSSPTGTVSH
jgi:hypothetical protein